MKPTALPRYCHASSSRLVAVPPPKHRLAVRHMSLIPPRAPEPVPFFTPPFKPPMGYTPRGYPVSFGIPDGKGKGREPGMPQDEEEVDDREWEIRSGRAMLHLRSTLPHFFDHDQSAATLFPPEIFSQHVTFKISHPIPLKISSLGGYSMAFAIARNGMQALHSDLSTSLERMTFNATPQDLISQSSPSASLIASKRPVPAHRYRQIRVQVAVRGTVRLPPHHEAVWKTSSLYTLSPLTGRIISHEVESIRPLPGEGVAEWLKTRLLGWTSAQKDHENLPNIPCPRAEAVPVRASTTSDKLTDARVAAEYLQDRRDGE